jgi:hypothetical protein
MDDELEGLIREIAAKHGVAVSRDDPILVLQTINNRLLQNSSKAQQEQLDQFKQELEAQAVRWGNDAKGRAERILNASLDACKDAMGQGMQDAAQMAAAAVATEIDAAFARLETATRDARQVAILNLITACITMMASVLTVWAILR